MEKKRSTYKRGSKLDLPTGIDKSKYGYRWISAERLAAASDGYEERGFELHKTEEGKEVRRGDLVLGRMPIDQYNAMKAEKEEARVNQMALLVEAQAEQEAREGHEFKKKGGKIKFEFKQEVE
jgi:hypothetical protein